MSNPNRHDLLRERLVALGPGALTDAELVAIHLGTGRQGEHVLELARTLLNTFGGVGGLARAEVDELARVRGVGRAKASRLVAAFALADRITAPDRPVVRSSEDVATITQPRIGRARTEEVLLVVLDGANRVRQILPLAAGGATMAAFPIREALALTLRHDGVALAIAHNHPGGDPTPSSHDIETTRRLRAAARQVGVRFLDHVVVTADDWRSVTAAS